jgi:hypothetical protein
LYWAWALGGQKRMILLTMPPSCKYELKIWKIKN